MDISCKKLQAAVGEELSNFLGQQFRSLQKEISRKFETLQDLSVQVAVDSLEKHGFSAEAETYRENEITTVASFDGEILPVYRDVVPKSVPHFVPDELEILDRNSCRDYKQKGKPTSIVPTMDIQATTPVQSLAIAESLISPPPLFPQTSTKAEVLANTSNRRTKANSRREGGESQSLANSESWISPPSMIPQASTRADVLANISQRRTKASCRREGGESQRGRKTSRASGATGIWKYGPRASVAPTMNAEEEKRQTNSEDFKEVVKAAAFSHPMEMKQKMRDELLHPTTMISNMYKATGLAQRIARNDWFEILTFIIIFFNALWMAVDLDMNGAKTLLDAHVFFIVMDNFFCFYFFIELLIRFCAFKRKRDCIADPWFCLDVAIVALMVIETWIMTFVFWVLDGGARKEVNNFGDASLLRIFRILRLSKITRVAKLLHLFPELVTMIRGFKFAARTVFLCFCLVINVIYVSALVFREFTLDQEIGNKYFNSVPNSMVTLLFQGTMPDVESFIQDIAKGRFVIGVLGVIFIFLTTFTLMNMLVGVIVGVVSEIAEAEKERRTVAFVKKELQKVFACPEIDLDFDGTISEDEFEILLTHPLSMQALSTVGVDAIGLVDVSDFIFSMDNDSRLSLTELVELILNLRGSNTATVKDIIDLRMFLTAEFLEVEKEIRKQIQLLAQVCKGHGVNGETSTASPELSPCAPPAPLKPQQPPPERGTSLR